MTDEKTKKPDAAIIEAPEPSKTAQEAMLDHAKMGHSVFDPRTGQNLMGTRNHAVGIAPEHKAVFTRTLTPQDHDGFVAANHQLLLKHSNSAIMSKHDPITGHHSLEVAGITPSKTAAVELGAHLGETHVQNLATGEKTATGATGEQKMSHVPVDKRFEHLRHNSPTREAYIGTHFSDEKLDKIEGARRGEMGSKKMPPAHADAERVHLGTKTGLGPDAPAGFYSVKAGHPAPPLIAAKKHPHPVKGNFAFATTEHPAFQQGYAAGAQKAAAAGADPKTAHALGLNTAEHALSDIGFDGYTSPSHPGVHFHFGDHEISKPEGR
jgi:hypothetical protein